MTSFMIRLDSCRSLTNVLYLFTQTLLKSSSMFCNHLFPCLPAFLLPSRLAWVNPLHCPCIFHLFYTSQPPSLFFLCLPQCVVLYTYLSVLSWSCFSTHHSYRFVRRSFFRFIQNTQFHPTFLDHSPSFCTVGNIRYWYCFINLYFYEPWADITQGLFILITLEHSNFKKSK